MNKHELRTIDQEAQRFMKDIKITEVESSAKLELPFTNSSGDNLYIFITKRSKARKFTLLIPVESTGLFATNPTLLLLQPMLKTYNLLLTQEAVIMEESNLPLHQRIRNLTQAVVGIDGVRRLWKAEFDRRTNA